MIMIPIASYSPTSSSIDCQVCYGPAHGNHFGVDSCRPCSAFFRRMALHEIKAKKCITLNDNCEPTSTGKWECKKCRYRKCLEVGMTTNKVQHGRDLLSSSLSYKNRVARDNMKQMEHSLPLSLTNFLGRPTLILSLEPDKICTDKTFIDVHYLTTRIANILQTKPTLTSYEIGQNDLILMTSALSEMRQIQEKELIKLTRVGRDDCFRFIEYHSTTVAKLLTRLNRFQTLDTVDQMTVFKMTWMGFVRLERVSLNAQLRGKLPLQDKMIINTNKTLTWIRDDVFDFSWLTNYSQQQIKYIMDMLDTDLLETFLIPIFELKPTNIELTFMLCQLIFTIAAKRVRRELAEKLEQIIDELSDNLHDYYVNEEKNTRYSYRLSQLLKVNKVFQNYMLAKVEKVHLVRMFDILLVNVSDEDFFEGMF